ncbi:uncharacterized protein LOC135221682 [Macrobrachium nipponense]|uniref:uncharacterized protein LOC135221682 n=1 Tax=Macrobrachium nipponense TaxID=159736 RepID=UPI0030C8A901
MVLVGGGNITHRAIQTCFYKWQRRFNTSVFPFSNMDSKRTAVVLAFCLLILGTLTASDPDPKRHGRLHSSSSSGFGIRLKMNKMLKSAQKQLPKLRSGKKRYLNAGNKIELELILPILSAITLFALTH